MHSSDRRRLLSDRTILLLSIVFLSGVLFSSVEPDQQPNQPSPGSAAAKSRLLPPPYRQPILVQYPPPEIDIPYTEKQLQDHLHRQPDDFVAHFYLMCLYEQRFKWERSLHHALRARQIDNADINVHLGIVYAYANLGRWQEAEAAVQAALKLSWTAVARSALLRVRGDLYMDRYRSTNKSIWLERALAAYQQALKADPANIQAQVGVARVAISRKQYVEAKRRLQKALSQVNIRMPGGRRKKALILYYLGIIEEMRGRTQLAQQLYQEAVKTHPRSFLSMTEGELIGLLIAGLKAIKEWQANQDKKASPLSKDK